MVRLIDNGTGHGETAMEGVLTAADFAPHIGKTFRAEGQPHELTFVTLQDRPPTDWPEGLRQPFSLILRSAPGNVLPEGFYRFVVEGGPQFEFYIMPIHTPSPAHQDYQVAFN